MASNNTPKNLGLIFGLLTFFASYSANAAIVSCFLHFFSDQPPEQGYFADLDSLQRAVQAQKAKGDPTRDGVYIRHSGLGLIYVVKVDSKTGTVEFRKNRESTDIQIVRGQRPELRGTTAPALHMAVAESDAGKWIIHRAAENTVFLDRIPLGFGIDEIGRRSAADPAFYTRCEKILSEVDAELGLPPSSARTFESSLKSWLATIQRDPSIPMDPDLTVRLARLLAKYHTETGEDLIRSAVVSSYEREGVGSEQWPFVKEARKEPPRWLFQGGSSQKVSTDVDRYVRDWLWHDGVASLQAVDLNLSSPARRPAASLVDFLGGTQAKTHQDTLTLTAIKNNPTDSALALNFITRRRQDVLALTDWNQVDAILPVPSSSGKRNASMSLARAIGNLVTKPIDENSISLRPLVGVRSQKGIDRLNERVSNVSREVEIRDREGKLRGKTVVILDDVADSDATLEVARKKAYEAGAAKVIIIGVGRRPEARFQPLDQRLKTPYTPVDPATYSVESAVSNWVRDNGKLPSRTGVSIRERGLSQSLLNRLRTNQLDEANLSGEAFDLLLESPEVDRFTRGK